MEVVRDQNYIKKTIKLPEILCRKWELILKILDEISPGTPVIYLRSCYHPAPQREGKNRDIFPTVFSKVTFSFPFVQCKYFM